jgi:protein TonB
MRGPDKNLEAEALRIINLLPNITPGRLLGRPVKVPFSIPITFRLYKPIQIN